MKLFSGVMISISVLALAGCAATEPQPASIDGTKVAAVKCKRAESSLGSHLSRDCSGANGEAKTVNTEEFMNKLQTPGAIPGQH